MSEGILESQNCVLLANNCSSITSFLHQSKGIPKECQQIHHILKLDSNSPIKVSILSQQATDKNIVPAIIGLRLPSTSYQDHPTKDAKVSRTTTQDSAIEHTTMTTLSPSLCTWNTPTVQECLHSTSFNSGTAF
jgi:hypothetical protein